MKWLADENIPLATINRLREAGQDVGTIKDHQTGAEDREVLKAAVEEDRALLTFDRDFGELIFRRRLKSPQCVVYLRFVPAYPEQAAELLLALLQTNVPLQGHFIVLDKENLRRRKLPQSNTELKP